jgi:hypothetical protein
MTQLSERAADELLEKANVVGVAPSEKEDKLVVMVTEKKPLSALATEDVVPRVIDGVRTDVVGVGRIKAMLAPGTSIGLRNLGTGTAGAVVRDRAGVGNGRDLYVLTNNHVAANTNRAMALAAMHSPGAADGLGSQFGRLGRFEPIFFNRPNYIDAALVRLDRDAQRTHPVRAATAQVGWRVTKVGRTTGRTSGTVLARGAVIDVDMGSQGVARFRNQIVTDYMLAPGDSGSLLTTIGGHPTGLCFAGSDSISLHNPISAVMKTLGVRF